ncbi:cell division protein FtsZ homolog 2-1, chloroplastic-like isoform X2 [Miscanthus floridulus]|uniref:cell division protein FtsZ homolog 2-1, chloroplastic-like isoform X2 n=1 Tax=Miscanthus floridulus TaxID=154761 RepID=UPI0034591A0B
MVFVTAGMGGGTGAFVIPNVPGLVNVDFADVRAIMQNAGSSLMGIGTATGKSRARDAALNAIQSTLLDIGIERATGIVWNITGGTDLTLFEIKKSDIWRCHRPVTEWASEHNFDSYWLQTAG